MMRKVAGIGRQGTTAGYRNRRGEQVEPGSFTATRAKNEFGRVLEQATRDGIVVVTRHDRPAAVVLPIEEFEDLASYRERELEALRGEFDALLARMQTPRGRRGVKAAFAATPERMGAAARAAARRG